MNLSSLLNYLIASFLVLSGSSANKNQPNQPSLSNSIVSEDYCAAHTIMEAALLTNPDLQEKTNQLELEWEAHVSNQANVESLTPPNFLLPVVFHVIHDNGAENIDDAVVLQALQDLNDAFANTGYYDQNTGIDTEIQFCLAKRNPDGNPTTGINRVVSPLTSFTIETQDIAMKDLSRWDPTSYINIWLVREICSASVGCGVAGYAYFPSSHGNPEDGIVLEAQFAGSTPANSAALAHEMGHYLGLYHTFQGGCTNNNCVTDGDRVCDTPPDQSTVPVPCTIDINSCSTDVNPSDPNNPFTTDQNDMFWNYMDYGDWNCYSAFTTGQDERMDFFIEGARASLLNTQACIDACPNPIFISVTPCDTLIDIGESVTFVNTSTGATNYEWTVNNVLEATTTDFTFNFATEGTYSVLLTAFNGDTNCIVTKSLIVVATDCTGSAHVSDPIGLDIPTCGAPGNPCKTIQYALDNIVCSGDTVFIYSGTYQLPAGQPNTVPIAKIPENYSVTFFGVEDNGPILIDGNNAHRAFQYNYYGSNCPDGYPDDGINVSNAINFAHLTIQNVYLQAYNCSTTNQVVGGGIQIFNSPGSDLAVSIRDCIFEDNFLEDPVSLNNSGRSVSGAAVYVNGFVNPQNAATTSAIVVIDSCSFSNNRCHQLDNGGHGGAVYIGVCDSATITNSTFCNNNTFSVNSDAGDLLHDRNAGGALLFYDNYNQFPGHEYVVSNCSFLGNEVMTQDGASFPNQSEGAAIFLTRGDGLATVTNATLTIGNSQFYDNKNEIGTEHVDNNSGTLDLNSIGINVFADELEFDLGSDTTLCSGATLFAPVYVAGATYAWSTGETGPVIEVTATGTYAVTITAGQCSYSDEISIDIENCSLDCEDTYFQTIGTVDQDEGGMGMIPSGDGNFYVKGYQGDVILISKMTPEGNVIWTRTLKVTNAAEERLHHMILDADGYLVGCGNGGTSNVNFEGFIFKYDPNADVLMWSSQINSQLRSSTLLEPSPTANYRVTGISWFNAAPGQAEDGYILSIDRNTGALSGEVATSYNTGNTDGILSSTVHNGFIYGTGVYNQGTGLANFRGFISKFDLLGNEQWSKHYIRPLSATARMYGTDIEIDQDSIVTAYYGDDAGTSFLTEKVYLTKTDMDGNLAWAKSYTFPGFTETFLQELVVIDEGYLITTYNRASPQQIAMVKIDKSGTVLWAKAYSTDGEETMNIPATKDQTIVVNNRIYVVGKTVAAGESQGDILVMKLDMDGNLEDGCPFVSDLAVEMTPYINPFEGNVNVEAYSNSISITNPTAVMDTLTLVTAQSCLGDCNENCEDTYVETLGTVDQNESGSGIIPSGDGNFYISGHQGEDAMIIKMSPEGEEIWTRTINITSSVQERIYDMIIDADGYLIACGNGGTATNNFIGFVFKYDPENNNLIWSNEIDGRIRAFKIVETSPTANYLITGVHWNAPGPGADDDAYLISIDRNTGDASGEITKGYYTTGTSESFVDMVVHNNSLYGVGRYVPNGQFSGIRPSVSKLDFSGNELWSRLYMKPLNSPGRLYNSSILIDEDSIVLTQNGDYDAGGTFTTDEIYFTKTDIDGNTAWTKSFRFPGLDEMYPNEAIAIDDGYLILAFNREVADPRVFLIKTSKHGDLVWTKQFTTTNGATLDGAAFHNQLLVEGDRIYIVGQNLGVGGFGDVLVMKLTLDGELLSECPFVEDASPIQTNLNAFDTDVGLSEYQSSLVVNTTNKTIDSTDLIVSVSCIGVCEDVCEDTYVQTLGTFDQDEGGLGMVPANDGNYFVKGYQGDNILLIKITPDGDQIWSRTFKLTTQTRERIDDLFLDTEGFLVGAGSSGVGQNLNRGFVFKYDPDNDILVWSRQVNTELRSSIILEPSSTDNYRLMGTKWFSPSPGESDDGYLISIDRNTGDMTTEVNLSYALGSQADGFHDAVVHNNSIYVCGRFALGGGFAGYRPSVTQLDFNGNVLWSRQYLQPSNINARLYATEIILDQDSLVVGHFGDFNGTNFLTDQIYLSKSDLNGNPVWVKAFEFPGYSEVYLNEIASVEDGYLVLGRHQVSPFELFLLKTDKSGDLLWSKKYASSDNLTLNQFASQDQLIVENDRIYISAEYEDATSNLGDVLIIKTDLDGDIFNDCPFVETVDVVQIDLDNFFDDLTLITYTSPVSLSSPTITRDTTSLISAISCLGSCEEEELEDEICDNGIDDDGDGLVDFYDPDCPCTDSLICGAPYYNVCAVDCSVPPDSADAISLAATWNNGSISLFNQYMVGDIDGDCVSDIVAVREPNLDLVVLNSLDGTLKYEATFVSLGFFNNSHLAIGDVDDDGMMEIFVNQPGFVFGSSNLRRIDFDPGTNSLVSTWISADEVISTTANVPASNLSPALADFNGDGQVEVYLGNHIFNAADGTALMNDPVNSQGSYPVNFMSSVSVAIDVLDDAACPNCSGLELVAGNQVYSIDVDGLTMNVEREIGTQVDGLTRIVDFDRDGDLDAVVTSMEGSFFTPIVYVWDLQTETLIGNPVTETLLPNDPANLRIGAVSVGDVDADGWPEIILATGHNFSILEDYQNGGLSNWGTDPSTLKATVTTTDESGVTGATLFDFDGDGKVEIVYRDQTDLRIFDENLTTIFQIPCNSATATEYPIVADVDSDGDTELLCGCSGSGLQAYQSGSGPWPRSRSIWNQYSYFAVNVNDNGSIPIQQQLHHIVGDSIVLNNFSQQQPISDENGDPIFPEIDLVLDLGPDTIVCDNGILELNAGSGFDTYEWHDGTTDSVYTAYGEGEYWVEVTTPCGVLRDTIEITIDQPTIISLPDTIGLCEVPCTTLTVTDWYDTYEWFPADGLDCTTCSTVTACPDGPMTYTVLGSSLLGCFSIDTVTIIPVEPEEFVIDTLVCLGESVVIGNVEIEIGETDTLFSPGPFGCENSTIVTVGWNGGENIEIAVLGTACENEFFIFDGQQIPPGGTQDFIYQSYLGCDSIIHVDVLGLPIYDIDLPETICDGDSALIFGEYQTQSGTYSMTFDSENDCDSTVNVILNVLPAIGINTDVQNTCPGVSDGSITASASGGSGGDYTYEWNNGETTPTIMGLAPGSYTVTVTDGNGCIEEISATVSETDLQATTTSGDVSCNGDADGFVEVVNPMADWTFSLNGGTAQADPLFDNLAAGTYTLEVVNGAGCSVVMNPVVNEPPVLAVDLGEPEVTIIIGDDYQLNAQVNIPPPYTITWSPTNNLSCPDGEEPNLNCLNPIVTDNLIDVTDYTVTVAAIGNPDCNATATIRIVPFADCDNVYDLPNAFTPDGDGTNDNFGVIAEGLRDVTSFEIYNRWGKKVFEDSGLDASWDGTINGTPAPSDVYLYKIRVECPDMEERLLSGEVSLIR